MQRLILHGMFSWTRGFDAALVVEYRRPNRPSPTAANRGPSPVQGP
jgi:hypothetical protein